MTTPTRAALLARLDDLRDERLGKEMSDDFAYSNGSIRRIDERIAAVRDQLAQLDKVAA
jgi:hypothetical protein